MTINDNQGRFFGKPIVEYRADGAVKGGDVVYRLAQDYDDELSQEDESVLYHHYQLNYTPPDTASGRRLARR